MLIDMPSTNVVAGSLMLSYGDFSPDRTATDQEPIDERPGLNIRQVSRELYGNAIKSITDMLALAKLIADGATISSIKPFSMPRVHV